MANGLSSIIGASMGFLGDLFGAASSYASAKAQSALQYKYQTKLNKQNYKYNTKLINQQNAFNESMMDKANDWNLARWNESVEQANTAHQREVADLRSAGLNPILSANGGATTVNPIQSAQTSSGNSQLSSSAGMPDVDYLSAVSTANNMRNQNKQVENELENSKVSRSYTKAQESNIYNQIDINNRNSASEIAKRDAEIDEIRNSIRNQRDLTRAQISKMKTEELLNNSNSAQSRKATEKIINDIKHYGVERGFDIGGKNLQLGFHWTSHPNESKSHYKYTGTTTEYVNGRPTKVRNYNRK